METNAKTQPIVSALRSLFIGDTLAMPVHWYYRVSDILRDFPGGVTELRDAPERHPGAIMSLHSTKRGGRRTAGGEPERELIGDVILRGRRSGWERPGTHYHHGMKAGENTLNAHCARWLIEDLATHGDYDSDRWLDIYVAKMTADPPCHPDTYAESYHRGFFANWIDGAAPRACAATTHDTASIGSLVTLGPLALHLLQRRSCSEAQALCRQHAAFTHPGSEVAQVVDAFVELVDHLRRGDRAPERFIEASAAVPGGSIQRLVGKPLPVQQVIGAIFSPACYLDGSWPAVCWLAATRGDDLREALIANTNAGGDNVHRGAVLGFLLGLRNGATVDAWWNQLADHRVLDSLFERFAVA